MTATTKTFLHRTRVARLLLIALVVAAPWPFGSVTPRFTASLALAVTSLACAFYALDLVRRGRISSPTGGRWVLAFVALISFQLLPLPSAATNGLSPASGAIYRTWQQELSPDTAALWHPVSVEPFETMWMLALVVALSLAYFLASRLIRRTEDRTALAVAATLTGVALSLFAVYQKARFGTVLYGRFPTSSGTPFGPFVNHNHFAGYVEACALIAIGTALAFARRSGALAVLFGGGAAFMAIALVLSQSRGGLLAFGAGLVTLITLAYDAKPAVKWSTIAGGVVVCSFLVLYAPSGTFDRWSSLGASPDRDASVSFRAKLWSDSLGLAARGVAAGTGLGTYAAVIPGHRSGPDETRAAHAESDWLEIACETGLAGVVIVLGFLFFVGRAALNEARNDRSERGRAIRLGLLSAAAALVVHGFVDFNFRIPSNALLFVVVLGALVPAHKRRVSLERWGRVLVAALLAVGALTYGAFVVSMGEARRLGRLVDPVTTEASDFSTVIQTLARARKHMPLAPETDFLIGRLYNEEAYRAVDKASYREIRLRQAVEQYRIALSKAPARGRYWFELAWTEASRGNRTLADRLFARAFALEPHWADLRANHALYLAASGRTEEAVHELERGLALEPGLEPIDALNVIGPYLADDPTALAEVVGAGDAAAQAVENYLRALDR